MEPINENEKSFLELPASETTDGYLTHDDYKKFNEKQNALTDAEKTAIANTSGTNTGDEDSTSITTKLGNLWSEVTRPIQAAYQYLDSPQFEPDANLATAIYQNNNQNIGALAFTNPTGSPQDGQLLICRIKSTNIQTFTWGNQYRGSTALALPLATTGSGATDYLEFIYNGTDSTWDLIVAVLGLAPLGA